MKNKFNYLILLIVLISLVFIIPTLSFFNKTSQSENNLLTTGEWVPAKTNFVLTHQEKEFNNQENTTSYIDQDDEYFQINIEENKRQFLSFSYRVASQESTELFDYPTIDILIGDQKVSQIFLKSFENEWNLASIDLSLLELEIGTHDLLFVANNTYDDLYLPQLEVKEVTTKTLFTKPEDIIRFSSDKIVSSLNIEYKLWENNQEVLIQETLDAQIIENIQEFEFIIPENLYGTQISYWSVDFYNNLEEIQYINIQFSTNLAINNFEFDNYLESENEINIQAKYENLSKTSKFYIARTSINPIVTQNDWDQATPVQQKQHHQYINNDLQQSYDLSEVTNNLVFDNITTNHNYLSLKLCNVHSICKKVIQNLLIE